MAAASPARYRPLPCQSGPRWLPKPDDQSAAMKALFAPPAKGDCSPFGINYASIIFINKAGVHMWIAGQIETSGTWRGRAFAVRVYPDQRYGDGPLNCRSDVPHKFHEPLWQR